MYIHVNIYLAICNNYIVYGRCDAICISVARLKLSMFLAVYIATRDESKDSFTSRNVLNQNRESANKNSNLLTIV